MLLARLTVRQYKRIFSLCHYFAIMQPVQRNESRHLGQNEMAGLKGKSGPPGNMNAFKHGLAAIQKRREKGIPHRARKKRPAIDSRQSDGRQGMKLTVRPLTPDLWPAVVDLFGDSPVCSRCWCMYWRIGAAYRQRPARMNKAAFREIVKLGPPPGLLAFDGDVAVGWCQLTPRDQVPELDHAWRLKRVDDLPVWSLSCF